MIDKFKAMKAIYNRMSDIERELWRRSCLEGKHTTAHVQVACDSATAIEGYRIAIGATPPQKTWAALCDGKWSPVGRNYAKYTTHADASDAPEIFSMPSWEWDEFMAFVSTTD